MTPRNLIGKTFQVKVCPATGSAVCLENCTHEQVVIDVVPVERVRELERGRDGTLAQLWKLRADRSTACKIGDSTLWGTHDAVAKAKAMVAHLKAKARVEQTRDTRHSGEPS